MTPPQIVEWVITHFEGLKYTDDPVDTGGATNFGVTMRTYAYWRKKYRNLEKTTKADVQAMTLDQAIQVGLDVFMKETGFTALGGFPATQLIMYDYSYHSGVSQAVMGLQQSINLITKAQAVNVDGKFGKQTKAYLEFLLRQDKVLALSILSAREEFMQGIMERNFTQRKYMLGWWKRTTKLQRELIAS